MKSTNFEEKVRLSLVFHLNTLWERELQSGKCSHQFGLVRKVCSIFFKLVIDGGGAVHCRYYHPWAGGPGWFKKTG